jgi:hypothetical protein
LRIQINYNLLSDSPFCESNRDLFNTLHCDTEDLIQDIKNGTPTCYLISGYRGAGKSSFILRIEDIIKKEKSSQNQEDQLTSSEEQTIKSKELVFVHVNFSRHESKTFLLRKLIRGLYLEIKDYKSFNNFNNDKIEKPLEENNVHYLEDLYEKTFYETSNNYTKTYKNEIVTIFDIDVLSLIKIILPGFFFLFFVSNTIINYLPDQLIFNIYGSLLTFIISLLGVFNIKRKIKKSKQVQKDFNRKSMYDDEIADHHFFKILKALQERDYKVVFVLDELDKVDDEDIDNLLKEMKPYLVSGEASFITVAGQNLFYKFMQAKSIDDDILSSIFSKFIHVPLFSRIEFQDLFERVMKDRPQFNKDEYKFICSYIDYLIFESKKVPRKFISLIRQNLKWEDNNAYIEIEQSAEVLNRYTQILDILDKIDDEEIDILGFDNGLRDYFNMQLFIRSQKIISSKKLIFTRSEILEHNGEP